MKYQRDREEFYKTFRNINDQNGHSGFRHIDDSEVQLGKLAFVTSFFALSMVIGLAVYAVVSTMELQSRIEALESRVYSP